MLVLVWAAWAAAAEPPSVVWSWRGEQAALRVEGAPGEHVALDAPADIELRWEGGSLRVEALGAQASAGVGVPSAAGEALEGTVRVSVCDDGGSTCRPVEGSFSVTRGASRRGEARAQLMPERTRAGLEASPFRTDAGVAFADARERARQAGRPLLVDFTAVWCPPCNLMAAEVFDAPERPAVLERYELVALDVDDPSSWPIKDQYAVGGYPTVLVLEADGRERARFVGYPDAAAFIAWLERSSVASTADSERPALDPAQASPEEAAAVAWRLVAEGQTDIEAWLARAASAGENADLRRARVVVSPNLDDARWLALHDPADPRTWLPSALGLAETEAGRAALMLAVRRGLAGATGAKAADLLWVAGEVSAAEDGPVHYAAAAVALRGALTGDPVVDRGHITFLAELEARAGEVQRALDLLATYAAVFPDEPTFNLAASRIAREAGRADEALRFAEAALGTAWGDNRLRATAAACEALVDLGRRAEAATLARRELESLPAPEPGVEVRTHRYRAALERFVTEADAVDPAPAR